MARPKKNPVLDGLALFAELAKQQGVSLDIETIAEDNNIKEYGEKEARALKIDEADAVLKSLHHPHSLMMKTCRRCGEIFSTNYCSVGYCSVLCRKKGFEEEFGVPWSFTDKPAFGKYEPPKVVSPDALKALYEWATHLIADYDNLNRQQEMRIENRRLLQVEQSARKLAEEMSNEEPLFAEPVPQPLDDPLPEEEHSLPEDPPAQTSEQYSELDLSFDF